MTASKTYNALSFSFLSSEFWCAKGSCIQSLPNQPFPPDPEDVVGGWAQTPFTDAINQAEASANREAAKEQPFIMQIYLAVKEKERRKALRTQGAAELLLKSFSVFSKRHQRLFKLKLPDKRF